MVGRTNGKLIPTARSINRKSVMSQLQWGKVSSTSLQPAESEGFYIEKIKVLLLKWDEQIRGLTASNPFVLENAVPLQVM